ncbi:hypothetical protein [Streptomyces collinus]|uniref:hypothetical protein n=1 Tax=Streptomyces collinus TaxID=42684 RepID=UPI002943E5BD|nr:hypothetical protein [Streptomyces collinus]
MDFLIGLLLIVLGAPPVGLLGNALAGTGRKALGRAAVSGSAWWCSRSPGG